MSAAAGERIRGIEAPLPAGERILWQGSPRAAALAVHVFHLRKVAVYFALLVAWRGALAVGAPRPWTYFAVGALTLAALFAAAAAIIAGLAVLCARTTTYVVTGRRVVLRMGMVLPAVVNIPLRQVGAAAVKRHRDGTGDLALTLEGDDRLAYFLLWPHARPWRFNPTHPALRCIEEVDRVGALLRDAVAALGEGDGADAEPADRAAEAPVLAAAG